MVATPILPAGAAVTCTYGSGTVSVSVDPPDSAVSFATSGGAIVVEAEAGVIPCTDTTGAAPTVTTTDSIQVTGTSETIIVIIDLGGGPFAPGMTPETDGSSEIEFDIDWLRSPRADRPEDEDGVVVLGSSGTDALASRDENNADVAVNLNESEAQDDIDVVALGDVLGAGFVVLAGRGGNDRLSGAERLFNHETFLGGPGKDLVQGGPGIDIVFGQAGNDRLLGGPEPDFLNGGSGKDRCVGGPGSDAIKKCESGSA